MTTVLRKLLLIFISCFSVVITAKDLSSSSQQYFPSYKQHGRVSVRNIVNPGIGYDHGYTTVETFVAPNPTNRTLIPFADLRGHVFNDGRMAANAGIGFRKSQGCMVYGINAYYDYRQTTKMHYNQVGIGAEALGLMYDFRINGYLPVGRKITNPYNAEFYGFAGHNMLLSQDYQCAMKGFSAEIGLHAGKTKFLEFYAAAGPYYFTEQAGPNFWGGKLRLACKFQDYFTIELSNSYDHYFRNRFQCEFTFNLPYGGDEETNTKSNCDQPRMLASRMIQPIERQEIIVGGHKKQNNIAIDPTTNDPFYFVFVDNTSHSNGTYESPYPTLTLAQDNSKIGDIIYVYPGDGTTTGMDSGITLKNNQRFWGSGNSHVLQTPQGNIVIPAQSSTMPNITSLTSFTVTLDSINDVSGFRISDSYDHSIFGSAAKNISISDCTLNHSGSIIAADQIHLIYNDATGAAFLNNLTFTNSAGDDIFINSTATNMTTTISNSTFQNTTVYPIDCSFANQANVSVTNNLVENTTNGYRLNFSGPATLLISDNNINGITSPSSRPIDIATNFNDISVTIENNNIQDNTCGGVHFVFDNTSTTQININKNTITNNNSGPLGTQGSAIVINLNNSNAGDCNFNLTNNIITDNASNALYFTQGDFNDFQFKATNNTITDNGSGGFIFGMGSDTFNLTAENNVISGGGDNGIVTTGGILIDNATLTINNNQITDNLGGMSFGHSGTDLSMSINNNNISNNNGTAIALYPDIGVENLITNITNNTINNNQNSNGNAASGIDLEQFINFTGTIENNTLSSSLHSSPDLYVGSTQSTPTACLELSGNSSENGYTIVNNTGTFNLAPCDVDSVNIGTIAQFGTITPVQSCPDAEAC